VEWIIDQRAVQTAVQRRTRTVPTCSGVTACS